MKLKWVLIAIFFAAFTGVVYERGWWHLVQVEHAEDSPELNTPDLAALPFFIDHEFTPKWLAKKEHIPATTLRMRSIKLTDQQNKIFDSDEVKDKFIVANFFFASCGGFCPRLMRSIKVPYDTVKASEDVLFVSFSVTPEDDTPTVLKQYAKDMDINDYWHLLTGSKAEILAIAREDFYADTDVESKKTSGDFLHSENVYLLDHNRRIRAVYNGNSATSLAKLPGDIEKLRHENKYIAYRSL